MLDGSLPTYTDQLLTKISTALVQLTYISDRALFYFKLLRPGTSCSLNLTFLNFRTVFACFALCCLYSQKKKSCTDGGWLVRAAARASPPPSSGVLPSFIRSYRSSPDIRARSPYRPASTRHDSAGLPRVTPHSTPPLAPWLKRRGGERDDGTPPSPAHLSPAVSTANYQQATAITSSPPAD